MQIINLEADISTPHLEVEMRTLRIGSGGTDNYPDLNNKPSINGTTLVGDILTANLGIKTSELTNDSGYITTADIPTKTSDLINDSDFTTGSALTAAIAAVSADIPTTTSQLTNDSGFLTSIDIPSVPTKTSDLVNDSGYITAADAPVTTVNGLTGDVVIDAANADYDLNNTIKDKIDALEAAIPTDTNDLTNGAGYITAAEAPVQSVNGATGDVTLTIPTDTNDLTNGAGYITAAEAPVQSVNGATGSVVLDGNDIEYSVGVTVNSKIDSVEAAIPTDTATIENVSIATLADGDYDRAVNELIVNIDANVNGYTEANIVVCGANIWDEEWEVGSISDSDGSNITDNLKIRSKNYTLIKPNTDYFIVCPSTSMNGKAYFYDKNKTLISSGWFYGVSITTSPSNAYYIRFRMVEAYGTTYNNDISINYPATDTQYHAYNGTTYNIPFGQSVTTGGTLNVTTGVLDITGGSTVSLTPTEVKTIIADNNIYTDSGDIKSLTYYKLTPLGVYNWTKSQI